MVTNLKSTSPAMDKGTNLDAPLNDFDGGPRPVGTAWDWELMKGEPVLPHGRGSNGLTVSFAWGRRFVALIFFY